MSSRKTAREWKLAELAAAAGVSPRTVRYYVQRGLLPAPPLRGPDTVYSEEHLLRLRAIRVLQARFLPLDAIQVQLTRLSPDALRALLVPEGPPGASAPAPPTPRVDSSAIPAAPPAPRAEGPAKVAGYARWELAPGLELHLAETADAKVRALAQRVRALIEQLAER